MHCLIKNGGSNLVLYLAKPLTCDSDVYKIPLYMYMDNNVRTIQTDMIVKMSKMYGYSRVNIVLKVSVYRMISKMQGNPFTFKKNPVPIKPTVNFYQIIY